jgi:hypothetical protein
MKMLSRLCLLGFTTAVACSYDASQLAGPPKGGVDGSIAGIDGARTTDVGTSSTIAIDAPAPTGGVGGATGTGGTASSRLDAAAVEIGGRGGIGGGGAAGGTGGGTTNASGCIENGQLYTVGATVIRAGNCASSNCKCLSNGTVGQCTTSCVDASGPDTRRVDVAP